MVAATKKGMVADERERENGIGQIESSDTSDSAPNIRALHKHVMNDVMKWKQHRS